MQSAAIRNATASRPPDQPAANQRAAAPIALMTALATEIWFGVSPRLTSAKASCRGQLFSRTLSGRRAAGGSTRAGLTDHARVAMRRLAERLLEQIGEAPAAFVQLFAHHA